MSDRVYVIFSVLALMLCTVSASAQGRLAPGGCGDNELFVNLSSDDTWRASMALGFARQNLLGEGGLEAPRPVTVFLNVRGVRLAVRNRVLPHDTYGLTGKRPNALLKELIAQGARVIVCPNCLKRSGFRPNQLVPDAYVGGTVAQILACSTTQLSY